MAGRLTALKVKSLNTPGRYGDGLGLWLQVRVAGTPDKPKPPSRSWLYRYMVSGKARQMGLGSADVVSLADARDAAAAARKLLAAGEDPIDRRNSDAAAKLVVHQIITFKDVAERYLAANEGAWRNAKHRWQWRQTLEKHAFPTVGEKPVAAITTSDVMNILEPIWQQMPETASRLRGRLESVLDYAKARDWRVGENPARWRGHISNMLPRRNKARTVQHHPALPWAETSAFMIRLRNESGVAAQALEFTVLTAARTGEAIGATWAEVDLVGKLWTVPAPRMKAGKEHRVPLTEAALAVLTRVATLRQDKTPQEFVFPGSRPKEPLSNMAMAMLMRRMKLEHLTVHGFRSTFRDWAAETTDYPSDVVEMALAHQIGDKVQAAYRRGDLFDKRSNLMQEWAVFCGQMAPQ